MASTSLWQPKEVIIIHLCINTYFNSILLYTTWSTVAQNLLGQTTRSGSLPILPVLKANSSLHVWPDGKVIMCPHIIMGEREGRDGGKREGMRDTKIDGGGHMQRERRTNHGPSLVCLLAHRRMPCSCGECLLWIQDKGREKESRTVGDEARKGKSPIVSVHMGWWLGPSSWQCHD